MQICTLIQTHNHASIPPLSICRPTNSIKALKALFWHDNVKYFAGQLNKYLSMNFELWILCYSDTDFSSVQHLTFKTHTHTHLFYSSLDLVWEYPGDLVPEPIWILLKQETLSGSGISWAICKLLQMDNHASSSPLSFYRPDAFSAAQPTASKHWRQKSIINCMKSINVYDKL